MKYFLILLLVFTIPLIPIYVIIFTESIHQEISEEELDKYFEIIEKVYYKKEDNYYE